MKIQSTQLKDRFYALYKTTATATYFSPGRVNLIGEHIDYHGGLVLPAALSVGTYAAVCPRSDNLVYLYSAGYTDTPLFFSLDNLAKDQKLSWTNYIRGVFNVLKTAGYNISHGLNLYLESTMPTSGGLSSSASVELLLIKILSDMFHLNITKTEMALLGKKVENDYIGVLSGIMDQFVIAHGKKDHALLLNTHTLTFDYIPLHFGDYSLVIANTNKRRGLADSKYNERYNETMAALALLQKDYPISVLTELTEADLTRIETKLDPITFKRVRHVVSEGSRTLKSATALGVGDVTTFAGYLDGSHASLRDDYEVTGLELDTLVSLMKKYGALGARMTGAGFGGCAIALVPHETVPTLISSVSDEYTKKIGYPPTFYETTIEDGTGALE